MILNCVFVRIFDNRGRWQLFDLTKGQKFVVNEHQCLSVFEQGSWSHFASVKDKDDGYWLNNTHTHTHKHTPEDPSESRRYTLSILR